MVKELKVGDRFKTQSGEKEEVKDLKDVQKAITVYNVEVDGNHNYFVSTKGILVHNKHIVEVKKKAKK